MEILEEKKATFVVQLLNRQVFDRTAEINCQKLSRQNFIFVSIDFIAIQRTELLRFTFYVFYKDVLHLVYL